MVLKRNGDKKEPLSASIDKDVREWLEEKSGDESLSNYVNKILKAAMSIDKHKSQEGD